MYIEKEKHKNEDIFPLNIIIISYVSSQLVVVNRDFLA